MVLVFGVILFVVMLLMGVPIAYGMLSTTLFGMAFLPNVELITVTQRMLSGLNSFTLLAVPMFIMAANLMNIGNISQQLVNFCVAIVGHIKGGTAYANVLVSMIFAGISGSSQADTAGIGKILIPGMVEEGYSQETAVGVTISSSTLGVIIPPSIPMVWCTALLPAVPSAPSLWAVSFLASLSASVRCLSSIFWAKSTPFPPMRKSLRKKSGKLRCRASLAF